MAGTVITPFDYIRNGHVYIQGGQIEYVGPPDATRLRASDRVIDATGRYVAPGFIDIHTYGACGIDTHRSTAEELVRLSFLLPRFGVTSFVPSVAAGSEEDIHSAFLACDTAMQMAYGAEILGMYSEGLIAHPAFRGAQSDVRSVCSPDSLMRLLSEFPRAVRIVMLAPDIPDAANVAKRCLELEIVPAVGHSALTFEESIVAFESGYRLVTHLFNGMPWWEKQAPGLIGGALLSDHVFVEVIPDGIHVHPAFLALTSRIKASEFLVIVTDSMYAAGTGLTGEVEFAGQSVFVDEQVARLKSGRPAASILTMDQAVRNARKMGGMHLHDVFRAAARNPAVCVGIGQRKGALTSGYDADVVLLDDSLQVKLTMAMGDILYDADSHPDEVSNGKVS